jgi:hypothetical protein
LSVSVLLLVLAVLLFLLAGLAVLGAVAISAPALVAFGLASFAAAHLPV